MAVFPQFAERFYIQLVTKIMIVAIFAMSLDLLVGYTGLVSFGHAAFFGVGGYALAIVARDLDLTSIWTTLPIAIAASGMAALVIGWLSIRTSGVYFIMITLAFAQMLFFVVHDNLALGGSDGMYLDTKPTVSVAGIVQVSCDTSMSALVSGSASRRHAVAALAPLFVSRPERIMGPATSAVAA